MTEKEMLELSLLSEWVLKTRGAAQFEWNGTSYDGAALFDRYKELLSKFLAPYAFATEIQEADIIE